MTDFNPILRDFHRRIGYISVWTSVSIVQSLLIALLGRQLPWRVALADASIFNALFAFGIITLWYPIRFNTPKNRQTTLTTLPHILLSYVLLAGVLVTGWITAGNHLMHWIIPHPDYHTFLRLSIGWRTIQGALFFTVAALYYTHHVHIAALSEKVEALQHTIELQKGALTRVTVKEHHHIHIIEIQEIDYIEAYGDYVQLHTVKGVFLKEHTMKFLEERLPSSKFVRIHRSIIVNIQQVAKIELYEKERYRVHLKNGTILKTSETGYKLLRELLR